MRAQPNRPERILPLGAPDRRFVQLPISGLVTPMNGLPMTPSSDGAMVPFSFVVEDRIPPVHRAFVRRHVDRLARELGLGHVRIGWFGPAIGSADFTLPAPFDDSLLGGFSQQLPVPSIAILASLRGDALRMVIAHEVRHLAQSMAMTEREREEDAERFGWARG